MRVVALVSGGKDSIYSIYQCIAHGHTITAIATLIPAQSTIDEIDSHMFQTIGHQHVKLIAECLSLPFYSRPITGSSLCQTLSYDSEPVDGDEIEDLFELLTKVKLNHPEIDAVCSGAIESNYQRLRVESISSRLSLTSLAYLWHQPQKELIQEMIKNKIEAILVKVASAGLNSSHIGKTLSEIFESLLSLNKKYGLHICGEGGEFESFTLDSPIFKKRIIIDNYEIITERGEIDPVSLMRINHAHVETKNNFIVNIPLCKNYLLTEKTEATNIHNNTKNNDNNNNNVNNENDLIPSLTMLGKSENSSLMPVGLFPFSRSNGSLMFVSNMATLIQNKNNSIKNCLKILLSLSESHPLLISLSLILADMKEFLAMNSEYLNLIPLLSPPSRTTIQCSLPSLVPLIGDSLSVNKNLVHERRVIHVQSLSEWAPACIGPYSQSTELLGIIFTAGQIPLQPCTMKLRNDPNDGGLSLAWQHINSILEANNSNLTEICFSIIFIDHRCKNLINKINLQNKEILTKDINNNSLMFVFVETLPRAAMIEIQSMAINNKKLNGIIRYANSNNNSEKNGIMTRITYINETFASIIISLTKTIINNNIYEAVKQFNNGLNVALNKSKLSLSSLWFIRIYYSDNKNNCNIQSFEKELFNAWIDNDDKPAISFIPVNSLSNDGIDIDSEVLIAHIVLWELEDQY